MFENGSVLVDGAVVNNLPVDIVVERYPGKRICIDIAIQDDFHVPKEYDAALPSGWQLLWSRLNPFVPTMKVPNIFDIITRTIATSSSTKTKQHYQLADLTFVLPVKIGFLDFRRYQEAIDLGYLQAIETMKRLPAHANAYLQDAQARARRHQP